MCLVCVHMHSTGMYEMSQTTCIAQPPEETFAAPDSEQAARAISPKVPAEAPRPTCSAASLMSGEPFRLSFRLRPSQSLAHPQAVAGSQHRGHPATLPAMLHKAALPDGAWFEKHGPD